MYADAAAGRDHDPSVVHRIAPASRCRVWARAGDLGWAFHGEGFVGSFSVELADEVVEAGLLLGAVHAGGAGCFFLPGKVHALVTPVLLGTSGLDALDGDDGRAAIDSYFHRLRAYTNDSAPLPDLIDGKMRPLVVGSFQCLGTREST
jgi:hypothetical protein